jgi:tetratricopeptide (TPR) repeat protein
MPLLEEVIEITRRIDNPRDAGILAMQATMAKQQGDLEEARRTILPAIENYKRLKHRRGVLMGQSALAHLLRRQGEYREAETYYRQSIIGWQELGQLPAVAHQIECLAYIAIAYGDHERAAKLLGAARSSREQLNALSDDPLEIEELALAMDQIAEAMGKEERDRAMAEGSLMNLDDAVQIAVNVNS